MLELQNLKKTYRTGRRRVTEAVRGISLEIEDGEMIAVTGRSGAGKSTLLNLIAGLDLPDEGEIVLNGEKIDTRSAGALSVYRSRHIGFVVQNFGLIDELTVLENVMLPLKYHSRGVKRAEKRKRAEELLQKVGMIDKADKYPPQLSGGECQRVAIARALCKEPSILLADEPTGSLDGENEEAVLDLFRRLKDEGKTVIIVTHDPSVAGRCDRTIRIENGLVVK